MPSDFKENILDNYASVTGKPRTEFFKEVQKDMGFNKTVGRMLKNGKR